MATPLHDELRMSRSGGTEKSVVFSALGPTRRAARWRDNTSGTLFVDVERRRAECDLNARQHGVRWVGDASSLVTTPVKAGETVVLDDPVGHPGLRYAQPVHTWTAQLTQVH